MNAKKRKSCILYAVSTVLLLMLDQVTKYLAVIHLKDGSSFVLIPDVFQLHYLENRGAAFGLMQGQKPWFVISTLLMLMLMVLVYFRIPMEKNPPLFCLLLLLPFF